jgi:outer membrane scaffolding protein for murein synthesis (MipA/OmpV family)
MKYRGIQQRINKCAKSKQSLMKISMAILLALGVSLPVTADDSLWQDIQRPAYGLWSLAIGQRHSLYQDVDVQQAPSLLVFGGYGDVFIEANRFGYGVYRDGEYFASLVGNVRSHTQLTQQDIDDSERLSQYNLQQRKRALEAGFQLGKRFHNGWIGRFAVLKDVSAAHRASEAELIFYRRDTLAGWRLLTTLGAQYQTQSFNRYYFGIRESEITDAFSQQAYRPTDGYSVEAEWIATYDMTTSNNNRWGAYLGWRGFYFNQAASDSPIVDTPLSQLWFVGIGRYF